MSKTVLLTGGAGFIGSHILEGYYNKGFKVVVVDNLSTGDLANINEFLKKGVEFVNLDIRDMDRLEDVFKKYHPDIINHHAAQKSVPYSVDKPLYDISVNIVGTMNLIQLAGEYGVQNFIAVSSGGALSKELVEDDDKSRETDMPQLVSTYAIGKFASEKFLSIYSEKYGFSYTVLRYANVYGPRQIADGECGVIPIFVNDIIAGRQSVLMTYPDMPRGCTRDYVFIEDIVIANMMVTEKPLNDVVNIGSGKELAILDIYEMITDVFETEKNIQVKGPREGDVKRSVLDSKKVYDLIGWESKISLREGLQKLKVYMNV